MKIKSIVLVTLCLYAGFLLSGCSGQREGAPRILVFSKTAGFYHKSIPDGITALQKLGREKGFDVDTTTNAAMFTEDTLKQYSAVIFLNTTGNVLDHYQQADFERYIQAGGGYVGIHAAADTEYHWPWYGKLVGAYFKSHPRIQEAKLRVHNDPNFPVTETLPDPWVRTDEWYNFITPPSAEAVNVLLEIDEKSYEGGENGARHPMVWYHDYDGGRSFYMELGHTSESYTEAHFLQLLHEGILYAVGKNKVLDYSKASSLRVPAENRLEKAFLAGGLDEPTEIGILPDLSVLIAERKGGIKFYNASDSTIKTVAQLDVYHKALEVTGVNVETGLLGLQIDPHYRKNHWVYIFYSPADTSVDRLSRFRFRNGTFDLASEQVILDVPTDREICCHTGGSIAFDGEGNLYVSTGDNTTPFDEPDPETGKASPVNTHGFAPLDDRPGFEQYDDRRSAGNTNDLRGKILRIHVNEDGSYSIPSGNLFKEGTPKTRPEIYVMGNRNPYRISVDKNSGYLYWGEVGPDAANDSVATRGPRGYDEINQAKEAGNFGWPYFVGDNYAYRPYDYATGASGEPFDPQALENNSRNNTGLVSLPPAQPAFIWYPYARSPEFPMLGQGGRTAMAGPVYYVEDYPEETRLPQYYNGKLFIYEWIRNWIKVVTMDGKGVLQTIEPFMPHTDFSNISDMETGPDGRLYIVEYGKGWFTKNPDAALSVITYNGGNRLPLVKMEIDTVAGPVPLRVTASAAATRDPDGDPLRYEWNFGTGAKKTTDTPEMAHTFEKPGVFPVQVLVSDGHGNAVKSNVVEVYAGNSQPGVDIHFSGNPTFYFPDSPISYRVEINDREDGHSGQSGFDHSRVFIKADYLQSPDKAALPVGHAEAMSASVSGKRLVESLDCSSCHKLDEQSVGPSFTAVTEKYAGEPGAEKYLAQKIISGGSGVWGEIVMPAHPGLSETDAGSIARWILSLGADSVEEKSLAMEGTIHPASKYTLTRNGVFYLRASYFDKGTENVPSLRGVKTAILRNPRLQATTAERSAGTTRESHEGSHFILISTGSGWLKFPDISLKQVRAVQIHYGLPAPAKEGWKVTLRLGDPDGKLLGETTIGAEAPPMQPLEAVLPVSQEPDGELHDVYFVFEKKDTEEEGAIAIEGLLLRTK